MCIYFVLSPTMLKASFPTLAHTRLLGSQLVGMPIHAPWQSWEAWCLLLLGGSKIPNLNFLETRILIVLKPNDPRELTDFCCSEIPQVSTNNHPTQMAIGALAPLMPPCSRPTNPWERSWSDRPENDEYTYQKCWSTMINWGFNLPNGDCYRFKQQRHTIYIYMNDHMYYSIYIYVCEF